MAESEVFSKRPGTTDKGKDYENMVIANIILEMVADDKISNFQISSNDKNFDAFDDVVIKLEPHSQIKIKAMQLKHSERKTLSLEHLKSKKGDFSIRKYFESFQKIKNAAHEFILFTNRPFDVTDDTKFQLEGEQFHITPVKCSPLGRLEISKNIDYLHKFRIVEDEWTERNFSEIEEYKTFFENFYLYTNQENFESLKRSTMEEFKSTYSSNEKAFEEYFKVISEWNMQDGRKEKLNKKWMQRAIALQLLSSQIEPLSFGLVNIKMKILREAISKFTITLIEEGSCDKVKQLWGDLREESFDVKELNRISRNYQLCTDSIEVNSIKNLDPKLFSQLLWLIDKCPLIIRENQNSKKAIQLCYNQKFILLDTGMDKEWMKNYSVFRNLSNLKPKLFSYWRVVENLTISIQGKQEFNLTPFEKNEELLKNVTTDILTEMVTGPCFIDGKKETLPEPYIERCLSRNIIEVTYLEKAHKNTLIILNCANNFDKVKDKLNNCKLVAVNQVSQKYFRGNNANFSYTFDKYNFVKKIYISTTNCTDSELQQIYSENREIACFHYFKVLDDGNLEWIKSRGDLDDLDSHKLSTKNFKSENALWSPELNNNINLLTGGPGMGKSELMKSFKNNCSPKYWTVIINPKDIHSYFNKVERLFKTPNHTEPFQKSIINEKSYSVNKLERQFFEICLNENNIVYVWDALDEIFNEYLDDVLTIILGFANKGCFQWVTSRQHMKTFLEKKFCVLSISVSEFSGTEQQNYIRNRLASCISEHEIEITIAKIKSAFVLVEQVDILGIPLQIFMVTELFRRNNDKYLKLLGNSFLLTDLYQYFIEEIFLIFFKDKMGYDVQNPHIASILTEKKRKALNHHEKVAFKVIFPEGILQRLNIDCQMHVEKVFRKYTSLGLVNKSHDNVPQFLHGSFAEYLVAAYFSKHFRQIPADIFFDEKYNNVRFFFDMSIGKNSPAHIAVLYKNFDLLRKYDDETLTRKDEGGRSVLHLLCSWGQRHPRVKVEWVKNKGFVFKESNSFQGVAESREYFKTVNLLQCKNNSADYDNLLTMTPYSYAKRSESLAAQLKLLQGKQSHPCTFDDRVNILYYSVLLAYKEITSLSCIQKSINCYGEINFRTAKTGATLLLLACEKDEVTIVKYLVESGAKINLPKNDGRTPLYVASRNGHETTVQYLVESGAEINRSKNNGWTPLHAASYYNHEKTVEILTKSGAETNRASRGLWSPLLLASFHGHSNVVEYLVKSGAEINHAEKDGATPCFVAAQNGHEQTVDYLVKSGAKVNRPRNDGWTPFYVACLTGNENMVEFLTKSGADINYANKDGATPFFVAAQFGHEKIVEFLVKLGTEINRTTKDGRTPLWTASFNGHEKTVEYLMKCGAEVNRATNNGCTPLYAACFNGHRGIVEYLVESGADVNRAQRDGETPLHVASENSHEEVVEYLMGCGAETCCAINDTEIRVDSGLGKNPSKKFSCKIM